MSPWAHIDELKKKHEREILEAIHQLMDKGYTGDVRGRLEWTGQNWRFPCGGKHVEARTLSRLLELVPPTRKAVAS